jgi:hypothetical protein
MPGAASDVMQQVHDIEYPYNDTSYARTRCGAERWAAHQAPLPPRWLKDITCRLCLRLARQSRRELRALDA